MAIRIFVSHSAADEPLATALVECILSSMVLDDDELRCTSVPGHKLPVGIDFASTLLQDIGESSVVVGLITNKAATSNWVLFELGATWGARKNLMPLVTDEVDLKALPGPLSGRHVAKLSSKADVNQFLEELATLLVAKRRSQAKSVGRIDNLLAAHAQHIKSLGSSGNSGRVDTKAKEPTFSGMPFSELVQALKNEKVVVPASVAGQKADVDTSIFQIFVGNDTTFSNGVQSNRGHDTAEGLLYHEVGLRLLTYGLVQFEKLPAAQAKWFKRLVVSSEGHKFLLQAKRLVSTKPV